MNQKQPGQMPVAAAGPYPPVKVVGPNKRYARWLSSDLASAHSELTAVCQYQYQNWILSKHFPEFSDCLLRIARVEMHHMQILGQLIVLLGGTPYFGHRKRQSQMVYWNGKMVSYQRQIQLILKENIAAEQDAYDTYLAQARQSGDPYLSAMLQRLAEDEMIHLAIFQHYLDLIDK